MVETGSAKVGRWWVGRPEAQTSNDDWEKILVAVETTFFSVCCGSNIALLRSLQVIRHPFEISFRCDIVQLRNQFVADDFGVTKRYLEPWTHYLFSLFLF
ncbi:hypothetical protein SESBI_35455 [Sesbania bispinosa]|nr:hypothetical protein SESBI_35455 [Sesbania bispinosa]